MNQTLLALTAATALLVSGCAGVQREVRRGEDPPRRPVRHVDPAALQLQPIRFSDDKLFAWFDGETGKELSFDEVLVRARAAKAVMVGEQHDNAQHHEVQRRIVTTLAQDGAGLVVGLEMLTWNLQPSVDKFNAGEIDADALAVAVDWKKAWGFTFDLYRPVLVDGRDAGARFRAMNAPRDLVRAVRKKGVAGLSEDEVRILPDLDLADEEHRTWFKSVFGSGGHPMKDVDVEGFYAAQVVWDETMAERTVRALDEGARQVVLLAGTGHVARGRGVPQRVERRLPEVRVLSIVPLVDIDAENAMQTLREAVVDGEGDILVVPRFEEALSL